ATVLFTALNRQLDPALDDEYRQRTEIGLRGDIEATACISVVAAARIDVTAGVSRQFDEMQIAALACWLRTTAGIRPRIRARQCSAVGVASERNELTLGYRVMALRDNLRQDLRNVLGCIHLGGWHNLEFTLDEGDDIVRIVGIDQRAL